MPNNCKNHPNQLRLFRSPNLLHLQNKCRVFSLFASKNDPKFEMNNINLRKTINTEY